MIVARGPETMTEEQIGQVLEAELEAEQTGTPTYDEIGFNPEEDLEFLTFTGVQSPEVAAWVELELEAGKHVLICFVLDREDGDPHAYHGMVAVLEVGE